MLLIIMAIHALSPLGDYQVRPYNQVRQLSGTDVGPGKQPTGVGVKPVNRSPTRLKPSTWATISATRPGQLNAAQMRVRTEKSNQMLKTSILQMSSPVTHNSQSGIQKISGQTNGVFEPGADYLITGNGFGERPGSAHVTISGKLFPLKITDWSNSVIFARVPADISNLPDIAKVELTVLPKGKPVIVWKRHGFRAARADVAVPIGSELLRSDPQQLKLPGAGTVTIQTRPDNARFDGSNLNVSRFIADENGQKKCIEPGIDRLRWNIALNPGFEITAFEFTPTLPAYVGGTLRGDYAVNWDNDDLRIDYGVIRQYASSSILFASGSGSCSSVYKIKLIATGPRGLVPRR